MCLYDWSVDSVEQKRKGGSEQDESRRIKSQFKYGEFSFTTRSLQWGPRILTVATDTFKKEHIPNIQLNSGIFNILLKYITPPMGLPGRASVSVIPTL